MLNLTTFSLRFLPEPTVTLCLCGRAELQSGHGDLEPVPPLGGRLYPAAQWQKLHRGPNRPVSHQFARLAVSQNMQRLRAL